MKIHHPDFKHFEGDARSWEFIAEYVADNDVTLPIELPPGYWSYVITIDQMLSTNDGAVGEMKISLDGGKTVEESATSYNWVNFSADASSVRGADYADSWIDMSQVNDKVGNQTGEGITGWIDIISPGSPTSAFMGKTYTIHRDEAATPLPFTASCYYMHHGDGRATHIVFMFTIGWVTSGTFRVYGLR